MRIFSVIKCEDAKKIASYLVGARVVFSTGYTFPDKVPGPATFVFKVARHQADNPTEVQLLQEFLVENEIFPTIENVY